KFIKGMFSYESLWHNAYASPSNPEYILTREYMADDNQYDWTRYIYIRPSQLVQGYSSFEPMQELIDAYWDINGKTIRNEIPTETRKMYFDEITSVVTDWVEVQKKPYLDLVPTMDLKKYKYTEEFRNRDSRLYASILFPFKGWHESDAGTFYYRWNPAKAGSDGNESWTGYSYRKMVALQPYDSWANIEDYPTIRYAEVLLTYAEARIQTTGWDTEVQKVLNDLRDRCGMPSVPTTMSSKEEALNFVRNERRIELAGEGHRYEDIRRYGSAYCTKVMSGTSYAPNGYSVVTKSWNDRLMLMPIPQSAMDLNPLLLNDQNSGY
uniref:RagB/SusD family nutrient uptake outer membrane protein n=1 Tax=Macellibacteroides fermentans TaxID=879969 RepID=UPI00406C490D